MHNAALRAHRPQVRSEPVPRRMGLLQRELYVSPAFLRVCSADFSAGGICTPPGGGSCTEQFCMPEEEKPEGGLEGRGVSGDDPESKDKANLDHECHDAGEGPKDGLEGRVDSKDEPKPKIKTVDEAVQCGPSTCEKG